MAKILVVDDEPDMIWAVTNVLLTQNHSVISVNSGEEALKKIQDTPLDLMLLDFRLPGMDGIQILEKAKQIDPDLPVIMLTGYGGIEEAVQAIKLGAAHYIAKPFDNDHLLEVVNKSLQLTSLKKEGVFGRRIAEKIDPRIGVPKTHGRSTLSAAPSLQKESRKIPLKFLWIGLFFILATAGSFLVYRQLKGMPREFPIPHSKVSGLSWGNNALWACDWFTQSVYQYNFDGRNLTLMKNYTMPGTHFTGIAWAGEILFTCDSWKKQIYKHAMNEILTVLAAYESPGPNPSGLFFDGKYLWSCDGTSHKIYQHALDDKLTVLNDFDGVSRFPIGLYKDANELWYAGVGGTIYKHSLKDGFRLDKTMSFLDPSNTRQISAFTLYQGNAWIGQEGIGKLFQKSAKDLRNVSP